MPFPDASDAMEVGEWVPAIGSPFGNHLTKPVQMDELLKILEEVTRQRSHVQTKISSDDGI